MPAAQSAKSRLARKGEAFCTAACAQLLAFQSDGRVHHRGVEAWLAVQAELWRCSCGENFSWYDETCHACGEPLASYGADPTLETSPSTL